MQRLVPLLAVALSFPALPASARIADVICDDRARIEAQLKRVHGVARQGRGLRGPDVVMEVWTSRGGAWVMVQSYASGQSCIVAYGEGWEMLAPAPNPA